MYEYRAIVTAVYDADTITVTIDLGFKAELRGVKLRLFGINAPEVRGKEREAGLKARDWLRERILDKEVRIKSHDGKALGVGKYGRWLAEVFPMDDGSTGGGSGVAPNGATADQKKLKSFNQLLVENGHAEWVEY